MQPYLTKKPWECCLYIKQPCFECKEPWLHQYSEMSKSVRHASKTDKICSCLTKVTQILVRMSDGEV